jgi:hypothetical protein
MQELKKEKGKLRKKYVEKGEENRPPHSSGG